MFTELQKARMLYEFYSVEHDETKKDRLWDMVWDSLLVYYNGNLDRVGYALDLLLESYLLKTYGYISCKEYDYKKHLLRGLDEFHY